MKLSTRTTYGMRAMLDLADQYGKGSIQLREIAERRDLPAQYLEQLMVPLRKAGLIAATRGVNGGYTLARAPESIDLAEIVVVLEGPLNLVENGADKGRRGHGESRALGDLWAEAGRALTEVFRRTTLSELLEQQRVKENNPADYCI